jgi:hypothetical protein
MNDLKPCPFCGGKILFLYTLSAGIRCEGCGAKITDCEDCEDAIKKWNRRARE